MPLYASGLMFGLLTRKLRNALMFSVSVTIVVALLSLTSCIASTKSLSQAATDTELIASGLNAVISRIASIPNVDPAVVKQLQDYLALIRADEASIQSAEASNTSTATLVQDVANITKSISTALIPIVPGVSTLLPVVQAAISMVPTLLTDVGVTAERQYSSVSVVYFSPSAARLILRGAATSIK